MLAFGVFVFDIQDLTTCYSRVGLSSLRVSGYQEEATCSDNTYVSFGEKDNKFICRESSTMCHRHFKSMSTVRSGHEIHSQLSLPMISAAVVMRFFAKPSSHKTPVALADNIP